MGTRNLTMVIDKKGDMKIAQYGQWDGYPSGQGVTILNFARNKEKMARLENEFDNIRFLNKNDKEYLEAYDSRAPEWSNEPDNRTDEDKYWWEKTQTRDLGGEILDSIITIDKSRLPKEMNGKICLSDTREFGKDSLFCEYAYCINLQTDKLMCFFGFNQDESKQHEWFETDPSDSGYVGCRLVKEYDLNNLPDEETFIKELESEAEDDE